MILWTDIETTGLDSRKGCLLEVGMVMTDDDLKELGRTSVLLMPTVSVTDPFILNMHAGLLEECRRDGTDLAGATGFLHRWLSQFDKLDETPMAGSSIHFDRGWLKAHMPRIEELFFYRCIDVSSFREGAKRWAPNSWAAEPVAKKAHRVLDDLDDSLELMRHYRSALFWA